VPRQITLNESSLAEVARSLATRDELLGQIFERYGSPPLWRRATRFTTLVHIILEQQVSLQSGAAMLKRLQTHIAPFTPERFSELDDQHLRSLGVTRQKAAYLLHLSSCLNEGTLNLKRLGRLDDVTAKAELMRVKGIGAWSAEVYLLMAMRRPDIWPAGDLALQVVAQKILNLESRPGPLELEAIAERWRPYRAVAARMLWHYYLSKKAEAKGNLTRS
jgi:DNA-3-methyladenine glycosylase II